MDSYQVFQMSAYIFKQLKNNLYWKLRVARLLDTDCLYYEVMLTLLLKGTHFKTFLHVDKKRTPILEILLAYITISLA